MNASIAKGMPHGYEVDHRLFTIKCKMQSMDLDFTAEQPGLTLFHCHAQLHMDYGFMVFFDCA